jgi:hypothetical protein
MCRHVICGTVTYAGRGIVDATHETAVWVWDRALQLSIFCHLAVKFLVTLKKKRLQFLPILKHHKSTAECVYVFSKTLRINSDYFPKYTYATQQWLSAEYFAIGNQCNCRVESIPVLKIIRSRRLSDFRFPSGRRWELHSSGLLRNR